MTLLAYMKEKWRIALGRKSPSQEKFTVDLLPGPVEGLAKYPPKAFASEEGIYAYRMWLSVVDASGVVACLRNYFPTVESGVIQQGMHSGSNGESLNLAIYSEFKGTTVALLTNSVDSLRAIDALRLTPLPPWIVFPHIDPDTLGSLQGDVDFWFWQYWGPFWDAASQSERAEYMDLHKPSTGWIEYFEFRDFLAKSHLPEASSQSKT